MERRFRAYFLGGALAACLLASGPCPTLAAVVFDDHFTGNSGGLPAGWSFADGIGTAVESGTVVSLLTGKLLIGSDAVVDPNAGGATLTVDIAAVTGTAGAGAGFQNQASVLVVFISVGGQIRVVGQNAGGGGQSYVAGQLSGYAGGPIRVTLIAGATAFRVSADSPPFDSGNLDYAAVLPSFTRADLGATARLVLINDVSEGLTGSSSFDRITVDIAPLVSAESRSFGQIKTLYRR